MVKPSEEIIAGRVVRWTAPSGARPGKLIVDHEGEEVELTIWADRDTGLLPAYVAGLDLDALVGSNVQALAIFKDQYNGVRCYRPSEKVPFKVEMTQVNGVPFTVTPTAPPTVPPTVPKPQAQPPNGYNTGLDPLAMPQLQPSADKWGGAGLLFAEWNTSRRTALMQARETLQPSNPTVPPSAAEVLALADAYFAWLRSAATPATEPDDGVPSIIVV
jgi:hypothetical protein